MIKCITMFGIISCLISSVNSIADEPVNQDFWQNAMKRNSSNQLDSENWKLEDTVKTFNEYEGKQILAYVRQGDYAHAGEEEAIDLILSYLPREQT